MSGIWRGALSYFKGADQVTPSVKREEQNLEQASTSRKVEDVGISNFESGEASAGKKSDDEMPQRSFNIRSVVTSATSGTLSFLSGLLSLETGLDDPQRKDKELNQNQIDSQETTSSQSQNLEESAYDFNALSQKVTPKSKHDSETSKPGKLLALDDKEKERQMESISKATQSSDIQRVEEVNLEVEVDHEISNSTKVQSLGSDSESPKLSKEEEDRILQSFCDGGLNFYRRKRAHSDDEKSASSSSQKGLIYTEEPTSPARSVASDDTNDDLQQDEAVDSMAVTSQEAEEIFSSLALDEKDETRLSFKDYVNQIKTLQESSPAQKPLLRASKKDEQQIVFTMRPINKSLNNRDEKKRILNAAKIFIGSIIDEISKIKDYEKPLVEYLKEQIFEPFEYLESHDQELYFNLKKSLIEVYKQKMKDPGFKDFLKNKQFNYEDFKLFFAHLNIIVFLEQWEVFKKNFKKQDFSDFRMKLAESMLKELKNKKVNGVFGSDVKDHLIPNSQLKECLKMQEELSKAISVIIQVMETFKHKFKDNEFHKSILNQIKKVLIASKFLTSRLSQAIEKCNNNEISLGDLDSIFASEEWENYVLQTALFSPDYLSLLDSFKQVKGYDADFSKALETEGLDKRLGISSLIIKIIQNPPKFRLSLKEKFPEVEEDTKMEEFLKEMSFKMEEGGMLCQLLYFLKS